MADGCRHVLEMGAGIGDERIVGLAHHVRRLVLVMFVGDLANDLLDDILDRNQPVAAAVFVDHQRQVNARRLHARQKVDHP